MRYHNRTAAQKKMLEFARQYLQDDDEVPDGPDAGCRRVLMEGVLGGVRECWVVCVGLTPQTSPGEETADEATEPPCLLLPSVLQMEVDGGEGPEVLDLPSDGEFEGDGDYEEGFFAEWWQEPKTKGDKDDQGS